MLQAQNPDRWRRQLRANFVEKSLGQATTVSFVNDGLTIYFGTAADSQRARNIARCDKVSLTVNRDYNCWEEIEGLSIASVAARVSDPTEQEKAGALMLAKFPQITKYFPADAPADDLALFRVDPSLISFLDYRKGFGHTELVKP